MFYASQRPGSQFSVNMSRWLTIMSLQFDPLLAVLVLCMLSKAVTALTSLGVDVEAALDYGSQAEGG